MAAGKFGAILAAGVLVAARAFASPSVAEGRRFSNSLCNPMRSKRVEMLNGEFVTTNRDLTITDVAGQTVGVEPEAVNINASNGVIHVIDTVQLPFDPSATDD